jgi:hypothetical protein
MTVLTRIKNNQVTDNTIEYQKLKDGTLVGSKFNANLTLNSNVTILGNLTVANSFAQLNSINTYINDPVVVFNNNYTGSPTYDIGILVNRNLSSLAPYGSVNAAFVWKEADSAFHGIMTTETGTTTGAINNSGFANLFIGNITANTTTIRDTTDTTSATTGVLQVTGGVGIGKNLFVASNIATTGAGLTTGNTTAYVFNENATTLYMGRSATTVSIGAGSGTTTINNGLITTGVTTLNSNLVAASGTNSTTNNTGALVVVGGVGIANDVNIGGYIDVDGIGRVHGNLVADSGAVSTNSTTGALVVVGGTGITGAVNIDGVTTVSNTTQSTTALDGALIVSGGTGIAKNLNVGGNVVITGNLTVNGTQTIIGTTDLAITDAVINLHTYANLAPLSSNDGKDIGLKFHYYDYQDEHAFLGLSQDLYLEWYDSGREGVGNVFIGNTYGRVKAGEFWAANTTASTDTATGAVRVEGGVGIKGNINGGNAVFKAINNTPIGNATASTARFTTVVTTDVLTSVGNIVGNSNTASSDITTGALVLTGTGGAGIGGKVFTGDTITAYGNIVAASGTNSTNTTTGALVVTGGAGIMANLHVGGSSVFNSNQTAGFNTVVKGKTDQTLIWARAGNAYDQVLIGNSAVVANLVQGAKLHINSTDSMIVPTGTNAQRPSSTGGTDVTGMFRYNTTISALEVYDGAEWDAITTQFTVIVAEQFNGDDTTTVFNMAGSSSTAACIVSINGVIQIPTTAYAVGGPGSNVLTFTEAPATGDVIDVRRLATTSVVTGIASTNGYMQVLVDNNGAYIYSGVASTTPTTQWNTLGAEVNLRANTLAVADNSLTMIDYFLANTYSSAEYTVTSTIRNTNIREIAKILAVHNNTTATISTYGVICTAGNALTNFEANIVGGNVRLYANVTNSNTIIRVDSVYQAI